MDNEREAVVVDAEGWYGDYTKVWCVGTFKKCYAFAKRHGNCQILKGCDHGQGDKIAKGILYDCVSAGLWVRIVV